MEHLTSWLEEKGILSSPDPQSGHSLVKETVNLVVAFYESDSSMPGKKDFVSVKDEYGRSKSSIDISSKINSQVRIGFSKFRPQHCVLAEASGTQSVCVCTIHQNVKLMLHGVKLQELTTEEDIPLSNYHYCIAQMICNPSIPECYFGECNFCPGIEGLMETLWINASLTMLFTTFMKLALLTSNKRMGSKCYELFLNKIIW